jgi:hypothetical protein
LELLTKIAALFLELALAKTGINLLGEMAAQEWVITNLHALIQIMCLMLTQVG